jgi:hypothetical protein
MKSPRPKIHLLNVHESLLSFHELQMRCGVVLKNAIPKFMRSEDLRCEITLPIGICRKCLDAQPEAMEGSYYEYGLVEGEEEKRLEGEEAAELAEVAA